MRGTFWGCERWAVALKCRSRWRGLREAHHSDGTVSGVFLLGRSPRSGLHHCGRLQAQLGLVSVSTVSIMIAVKQSNGMEREGPGAPRWSSVWPSQCALCAFLQINQTHLPALLVRRTSGAPPSRSPGTAPPTTAAAPCSPTPWRSGTRWTANGQTSPPAAAPPSACRTCSPTASTNSACELPTSTASASPAKSLSW